MESKQRVVKVFLDANIFLSGSFSRTGASCKILSLCRRKKLHPQTCQQALSEAENAIKVKVPQALPEYQKIIQHLTNFLEILPDPTLKEIKKAEKIIVPKDAPILAIAMKAKPDYLITLDKKHFITPTQVREKSGLNILTPGKFVQTKIW
jgi:putative PIN family toxin of toxin-antitoxin system